MMFLWLSSYNLDKTNIFRGLNKIYYFSRCAFSVILTHLFRQYFFELQINQDRQIFRHQKKLITFSAPAKIQVRKSINTLKLLPGKRINTTKILSIPTFRTGFNKIIFLKISNCAILKCSIRLMYLQLNLLTATLNSIG